MGEPTAQIPPEGIRAGLNNTGSTILKQTLVKLVSSAIQRIAKAGAGQLVYGVTLQDIPDGGYGDIQTTGKAIVLAGGTIAIGGAVASDASGLAVAAAAADTTAGVAVTAGAAAGQVEVELAGPAGGTIVPTPPT